MKNPWIPTLTKKTVSGHLRISNPSKVPGTATHFRPTGAASAAFCSKSRTRFASIVTPCAADNLFPNVKEAMEKRLKSLTHPQWIGAVTTLIYRSKDRYFRWHDSGDLQSIEHLRSIIRVCGNPPRVKFGLPTREYPTVEAYRRMAGRIPGNLCIRYSAHLLDAAPPLHYGLPVSTVSSRKQEALPGAHHCPAAYQGNNCGSCRACWNPRVKIVQYPLK